MTRIKIRRVRRTAAITAILLVITSMVSFIGIVGGATAGTVELDKEWYSGTDTITVTVTDPDENKPVQITDEPHNVPAGETTITVDHTPIVYPECPVVVTDTTGETVYAIASVNPSAGTITLTAPIDPANPADVLVDYTYDGVNEITVDIRDESGTVLVDDLVLTETGADTGVFTGTTTDTVGALGLTDGALFYAIYEDESPAGTRFDTARVDMAQPTISDKTPEGYVNTKRPTISFKLEDPGAPDDGSGLDWDSFDVTLTPDGSSIKDDGTLVDGVFTYAPTSDLDEGTYTVSVQINDNVGNALTDSFSFTVKTIPETIAGIHVSIDEDTLYADDTTSATITVQLVDNMGFPVLEEGILVDMSTDIGQLADVLGYEDPWTDTNGKYQRAIKSKNRQTGVATVTIQVGSWTETLQVTFIPSPMNLELSKGWNLVSIRRSPADPSVSGVFGETGKIEKVYSYEDGSWKTSFWDGSAWVGTLSTIEDGKGYWVYCNEDVVREIPLKVSDPWELPPSYELDAGWNLIGYTSLTGNPSLASNYFASLTKEGNPIWASAYFYDPETGYTLVKPSTASEKTINPGEACWIYLLEPGTLVP